MLFTHRLFLQTWVAALQHAAPHLIWFDWQVVVGLQVPLVSSHCSPMAQFPQAPPHGSLPQTRAPHPQATQAPWMQLSPVAQQVELQDCWPVGQVAPPASGRIFPASGPMEIGVLPPQAIASVEKPHKITSLERCFMSSSFSCWGSTTGRESESSSSAHCPGR